MDSPRYTTDRRDRSRPELTVDASSGRSCARSVGVAMTTVGCRNVRSLTTSPKAALTVRNQNSGTPSSSKASP